MSREDKLKKLADSKAGNEMAIITNGTPFIEALQSKIDELKKTLGVGVEIDAYDLINELKNIQTFVPAIKDLVDSLDGIEIPEVPKSIEVKGLADVSERFEKQVALLEKIANLKLPDVDVKVEAISKENTKTLTKEISRLTETNHKVGLLNAEVIDEVAKKLDNVIDVINNNKPQEPSQSVDDYTPIRRVRKIGNILVFDDDAWSGGGGGGGTAFPYVNSEQQAQQVELNPDGSIPVSGILKTERFDYSGNPIYVGSAPLGSSESDLVWTIEQFDLSSSSNATGKKSVAASWTNRATEDYN